MRTEIIKIQCDKIDKSQIEKAGEIIRNGGLVAFPTETVYGLGGDALRADASKKIYEAKGRPSDNPLIVHITKFEDLLAIAEDVPEEAKALSDRFWPGPLTMIVHKNKRVPYETTGGMDTVAVRMPSHPVARALIDAGGGFIAAPSANTSGRPSPTLASHVAEDMEGRIPMILDGGPVGIGIESTIVDLTEEEPMILRPGYITPEMLEEVIGPVKMDPGLIAADSSVKPKAPGMKYRHYAPKADLVIVEGEREQVIKKITELTAARIKEGKKTGVIATDETREAYPQGIVLSIGTRADEDSIAKNLYQILREFDELQADCIFSESFEAPGIGHAIMNRLLKAAGHQVIQV